MLMSENYDAIIIGSGLGGLSCGSYLSKNNWKVLVLEKHSIPGGYASSFKKDKYTFDSGLHMLESVGKDQSMRKFLDLCGISEEIEFIKLKYFMRNVFPEHDIRLPSGNLEALITLFEQNFPEEKEGVNSLFKEMIAIFNDFNRFLPQTAPMWQQLPLFPFKYRSLFPALKKTIKQLVDKHLKDEKLKTLLFANYGFYGLPTSEVNIAPLIGNMGYWMEGAYYPKGGSQTLPNAFVELIKRKNGDVFFNTKVVSIIVKQGTARGVTTKTGKKYFGKQIISNIDARKTFHTLVGDEKLPAKFVKKIDRMKPSVSAFIVYICMDEKFKAILKDLEDYEIFISNTYDQNKDYKWILDCDAENASFYITLYSNVDKSLVKNGKFILSLIQGQSYKYWEKFEGDYNAGNKTEYNKEKDRIAGILVKRSETVIPNLSKHIEFEESATPLTLKRFTGNFNGAIYGWANAVNQVTPMDRLTKLPIKNLHLSSAWTYPGAGQAATIACGCNLGRKLRK